MMKLVITIALVLSASILNIQDGTAFTPDTNWEIEKTVYYVKVGNTISILEDKEGYIIAAKRLGMETIQIIPDGKIYRTVSLDLNKDNEALKEAIEVKLDEIIIK
jgi:hypothetical protein